MSDGGRVPPWADVKRFRFNDKMATLCKRMTEEGWVLLAEPTSGGHIYAFIHGLSEEVRKTKVELWDWASIHSAKNHGLVQVVLTANPKLVAEGYKHVELTEWGKIAAQGENPAHLYWQRMDNIGKPLLSDDEMKRRLDGLDFTFDLEAVEDDGLG